MSAQRLREAARLMRERAEAAQAEDAAEHWEAIPSMQPENDGWIVAHSPSHADYDTTVARAIYDYDGIVSQHIASWHPAVALAVADWLEHCATIRDEAADGPLAMAMRAISEPADALADAYLGSDR